jgi:hypothetical protein
MNVVEAVAAGLALAGIGVAAWSSRGEKTEKTGKTEKTQEPDAGLEVLGCEEPAHDPTGDPGQGPEPLAMGSAVGLTHPAGHRRLRPRPWKRGRRLGGAWVDFLAAMEWPDLLARLESGEVYDPVGERIARQFDRNVAEMPELDGNNIRRELS